MDQEPKLEIRWWKGSLNAKGVEAIKAVRLPVSFMLISRAAVAMLTTLGIVATALLFKPEFLPLLDRAARWWP